MRVAVVALAILVSACSQQAPATPASASVESTNTDDNYWRSFEWLAGERADGSAWLQYSPDESDNVHMLFECNPRGYLFAESFDPRGLGEQLVLRSGAVSATYDAQPIRDETGDFFGDAVKSRSAMTPNDDIIIAFRRSGSLEAGEPPTAFRTATPEELTRIEAFFASCVAPESR